MAREEVVIKTSAKKTFPYFKIYAKPVSMWFLAQDTCILMAHPVFIPVCNSIIMYKDNFKMYH